MNDILGPQVIPKIRTALHQDLCFGPKSRLSDDGEHTVVRIPWPLYTRQFVNAPDDLKATLLFLQIRVLPCYILL